MEPTRFVKFLGVIPNVKDGVCMVFHGADGREYAVTLLPNTIPATIVSLMTYGAKMSVGIPTAKGEPVVIQSLFPTNFSTGATEAGQPVLYFHFGPGPQGALPIELTKTQLREVIRLASELDRLTEPNSDLTLQ